jgi:hypothetical protein
MCPDRFCTSCFGSCPISVPLPRPTSENGAQEGTRTLTPYGTRPSNVCVYQFHHLSDSKTEERRLSEIGSRV